MRPPDTHEQEVTTLTKTQAHEEGLPKGPSADTSKDAASRRSQKVGGDDVVQNAIDLGMTTAVIEAEREAERRFFRQPLH